MALPHLTLSRLTPQAMMAGLALMALWPAGQLAAEVSRDFLDYLRNPGPAPELHFAAPDRVAVNGVKAPALPEAAQPESVVAAAAPTPEPAPEPAPAPEALPLAAVPAPPLASVPAAALGMAPAPALVDKAPDAALAAQPPAALADKAPLVLAALPPATLGALPPVTLQGQPVVVPEPGSPEALFGPTPQGKDLVRAVQQLLKDQNCYSGAVDGGFGAGSVGSLNLFYDANPALAREGDATEAAWRALQGEALSPCKAPYAKPKPDPKPAAQASNKPASNKPAASTKPAAAPKPAPAAPKPAATSMSNLAAEAN
ncbi:hypothetical protein NX862_18735 [Rhodobacter sp. KR11]|uniref:hypothetical protein n=1 Tax=Rhodobacter sp. KR11 TaxID=2974588 RepID=UPI002221CB63|nr:hypothetical protein [Rhodobacter sp. KR11]MCW1920800.1 hypothetical protein [Rhodobacter sp. KR11]